MLGGPIQTSNLVSYSLTFGSNTISNTNAVGASLIGVWANDLDTIAAVDLRASTAVGPSTGLGLVLMLGGAIISTSANCPTDLLRRGEFQHRRDAVRGDVHRGAGAAAAGTDSAAAGTRARPRGRWLPRAGAAARLGPPRLSVRRPGPRAAVAA